MTIRHMFWVTVTVWLIVFSICIMFHIFGLLDKSATSIMVAGAILLSGMPLGTLVIYRSDGKLKQEMQR